MSTRLYVSNLPLSATEERLTTQFSKFGSVLSVALDAVVRASRRGAFVEMGTSADARRAIARGQEIFNTKPITLTGIGGLNGQAFANGVMLPESFVGD